MRAFFNGKKHIAVEHKRGAFERVLVLASSNLLLHFFALVYRMMLTRLAGSEALGLQSLVMQVYSIMVSVCISGLNIAVITMAAKTGDKGAKNVVCAALILFAVLFLLCAAPIFVMKNAIAERLIGDKNTAVSIVLVLGCILLTGIENILKSVHIATKRERVTAASELIEQSIRYIAVYLLLKSISNGTAYTSASLMLLGMLLSEFFSVSFLFVSFRSRFRAADGVSMTKTADMARDIVKILVPAGLTSIVATVFASAAALMLPGRLIEAGYTRSLALSSIGTLQTVCVPIVMLPMAFVGAVAVVAMPSVSSAAGDIKRVRSIAKKCFISSLAALMLFNIPLMNILLRAAKLIYGVTPTRLCFIILSVKAGIIYLQVTSTAVLNGLMQQKKVLYFALIGEGVQLVLIYSLASVRGLHIYGYLASMCIGEGIRLIISMLYLNKLLKKEQTALAVCKKRGLFS